MSLVMFRKLNMIVYEAISVFKAIMSAKLSATIG